MKTNTKKLLSILLALMMMLSVVPFYASAAPETLAASNVQSWPTLSYNNPDGKMYYGQTLAEGLTINDDEIVLDAAGNQVAGHFEFFKPTQMQSYAVNAKSNLTFVPDDTSSYKGFTQLACANVLYNVQKTTLVLADENNPPVAASQIVKGATLSTVEITGGQVKNPYNATESNAAKATWVWLNPDTVVTESGEYEAKVKTTSSYEEFIVKVYVEVESSVKATTISELPIIEDFGYTPGLTFGDIELIGGKAVEYGTDIEVPGTFTVKNPDWSFSVLGSYDIAVVFTPDETESYTASECTVTVNVTKGNYKFVDENGEEIVPEITLPYGTTFDTGEALGVTLKLMIKDRNNVSSYDTPVISFPDYDKDDIAPVGTNTYNVRIRPNHAGNSNYNVTDLQFVLTIEPVVLELSLKSELDDENANISYYYLSNKNYKDPTPKGTFTYYIDGELVAENVSMGYKVKLAPENSGDHEIKIVYTPTENDPCIIEDINRTTNIKLLHKITRGNLVMGGSPEEWFGDEVTLRANITPEDFGGWKITDANGNEVDLGVDLTALNITFAMPDFDITVEIIDKREASSGDDTTGGIDDIFGDLTEGDSDNPFENIINNLIAFFKNIINTIKNFFRGIGDMT